MWRHLNVDAWKCALTHMEMCSEPQGKVLKAKVGIQYLIREMTLEVEKLASLLFVSPDHPRPNQLLMPISKYAPGKIYFAL